ncbi:MAG TPA: SDR family NAD(P)-dependent oxidoreductase [Gemmatimonadales bacterium]|nr:SDR family NAD(P)-dependent oxidoreductase [Gemmatimonadales bacterium]
MTTSKRIFDIGGSLAGLILLWPVFAAVALLVRLEDGGPVLFRQERVGVGGRFFRMLKFRTMRRATAGALLTVADDPRVTRVGRWLRRFRLDELPQLVNVLRGEMSLVGPRPEVPQFVAHYTREQRRVLELVPGITDPASLHFLDEEKLLAGASDPEATYIRDILPKKIRLQLDYAAECTAWRDFLLILDTLVRLVPRVRPARFDRVIRHRRALIVAVNILLIAVGYAGAYALRFDFAIPPGERRLLGQTLPVLLTIRLASYIAFGLHRGHWQFAGLPDLRRIVQATTVSSVLFIAVLLVTGALPGIPRSVLLVDWGNAILLAGGVRLLARSLGEAQPFARMTGRRTLVIGAGCKADRLLREVRRDPDHPLRIIGLVVDDPRDRDVSLHGYTVLGTLADLGAVVARHRVEFIVIALDQPGVGEVERVVDRCLATGIEFKMLPSLRELLAGTARIDQLRSVRVEDLLGRDPVLLDHARIQRDLGGKVVLVTGGAGSIGAELCRQIARAHPARLVLVDQAESPLYDMQLELRASHPDLPVVPIVCDVTDDGHVQHVFATYRPDTVIHAAAYKHVPLMEHNLLEAVRNNVFGTLCVAEAAATIRARKFILISTDKAVKPTSVMGASKRVSERIVLGLPALRASNTDFRAVRFGNVLGSTGSVLPLFERQLERGGPLTVTHPDVERYFMTIPEASQLVLQAAAIASAAGRIVMLDMGRPVRILDLAHQLIRLAGLEPGRDVQVVFTGLRPGEKLQEELVSELETTTPSEVDKVRIVDSIEDGAGVAQGLAGLGAALAVGDVEQVLARLRALVPEGTLPGHGELKLARRTAAVLRA